MTHHTKAGFSLLETMVALMVLLVVGGVLMTGTVQLMKTQTRIASRTEMHTSVRSATELLTQEIGQAGKVAVPGPVTLQNAAAINSNSITVTGAGVAGLFENEQLVLEPGNKQEWITIAPGGISVGNNSTTLTLTKNLVSAHSTAGVPVQALGSFATGVIPPKTNLNCVSAGYVAAAPFDTSGSDCSLLKLYGDVNGDGNMVYIEYKCDTANNVLTRQQLAFNAAANTKITNPTAAQRATMTLLTNITANPNQTGCFQYQMQPVSPNNYVVDVAITLTTQSAYPDPVTHQYSTETKALLNVAPRNVFDAYWNASLGFAQRVQPTPTTVAALL